jgi:hypothetical protein
MTKRILPTPEDAVQDRQRQATDGLRYAQSFTRRLPERRLVMAGPVGIGGSGYVQRKEIKRNWRYLLLCAVIMGVILYFWLHG